MSSTHKTFQTGEILSADDVNNTLNPTTADHIAYAIESGLSTIPKGNSNIWSLNVSFSPDRFSKPPVVVTAISTTAGGTANIACRVTGVTSESMKLYLLTTDGSKIGTKYGVPVTWIAIQQDA